MNPVFVIGYPRSGTTLLLHLLMSSGEFPSYGFSESHFFSHCYKRYGSLTRSANRARLMDELARRLWFSNTGVTAAELQAAAGENCDEYEAYFGCFMDMLARKQGKTRWLEKTPWHMLYVKEIRAAFPNAKFLLLVRDPRDVVLSIGNYGWTSGPFSGPLRSAIAWQWHMRYLHSVFGKDSPDCLTLRYEDMVDDTETVLARINSMLGLNITAAMVQQAAFGVFAASNSSFGDGKRGIDPAPIGRWRKQMSAELMRQISFVLHDLLQAYGYEVIAADPPSRTARLKLNAMTSLYGLAKQSRMLLFPLVRR